MPALDRIFPPEYSNPYDSTHTYECLNCGIEHEAEPHLVKCAEPGCRTLLCPSCDGKCAGCYDLRLRYCEGHRTRCEVTGEYFCPTCHEDHERQMQEYDLPTRSAA